MSPTAVKEKPKAPKDPWTRVIIPSFIRPDVTDKEGNIIQKSAVIREPQANDFVLARVDKAYRAVVETFTDEATVKPKALVFNKTMRAMFRNVTSWGDKPCVNVEVDRSDEDEKPSFYFEY